MSAIIKNEEGYSKYKAGDKVLYTPIKLGVTQSKAIIGTITRIAWDNGSLMYYIDNVGYRKKWIKSHFELTTRRQLKY